MRGRPVAAPASVLPPRRLRRGKSAWALDAALKRPDALRENVETWLDCGEGAGFPMARRSDLSATKREVG